MTERVYHVYLVRTSDRGDRVRGGEREITSPVEGYDVEFYESGFWLTRETGRNFFPYEQVRTIREHPAVQDDEETYELAGDEPTEDDPASDDGPSQEELADPDS